MRSAPLDGVRALAIVAVLLFHAHYEWAAGGYLGVDLFFVLSGYLITGVLLSTHRSWWGYRDFLVRRAVRLVPALAVAMAGVAVVVTLVGTERERSVLGTCTAASLGYVMNLPFAEDVGCRAIWHVTWSLASEQQFYLVWPLVLAGLAYSLRPLGLRAHLATSADARRRLLAIAALGTANLWVLSLCWQAYLLHGGAPTSRIVFAPDGRSLVLLLGCALALLTYRRGSRSAARPRGPRLGGRRSDAAAGAAVAVLAVGVARGGLGSGVVVLLPLVAAGLASVVLVRAAAVPGPVTRRLLGARPVAWLGRVSYSLYLWHEVAYTLAEQVAPRGSFTAEALRFSLALAFAAASYHWVERPAQRWWQRRGETDRELSASAAASAGAAPTPSSRIPHQPLSPRRPAAAPPSTPAWRR